MGSYSQGCQVCKLHGLEGKIKKRKLLLSSYDFPIQAALVLQSNSSEVPLAALVAAEPTASTANGFLLWYQQRLGLEPDYYRC